MGKRKNRFNQSSVREVVCRIPRGRVTRFGDISHYLTGSVNSAVAVGNLIKGLREQYNLQEVPVHRVVRVGGYIPKKENARMLEKERVRVCRENRKLQMEDFEKHFWNPRQE